MNPVHYSSATPEWETPQDLFDELDKEFGFDLDVCATDDNAKCIDYFTQKDDGLSQSWSVANTRWLNPPYGRIIYKWIEKASKEAKQGTTVSLIPARTDTRWWHDFIWDTEKQCPRPGVEIRFLKGRLKFGGAKNSAPFPSVIVIFRGEQQ